MNTLPLKHLQWQSPLGPMWLSASTHGLCGVWFLDQKHMPAWLSTDLPQTPGDALLQEATTQLHDYFSGQRTGFDLPLDLEPMGTPLQRAVWQGLCAIDSGHTLSYGDLSRRVGRPRAVRAVAAAVGRNPVAIIVPCHRVIGADGSLTGYAGGLHRKAALLELEQRHTGLLLS